MANFLVASRYELNSDRLIGKGAFCRVYKGETYIGRDTVTNTDVAVKVILEGKSVQLRNESTLLQQKLKGKREFYIDFPEVLWQGMHEGCETQVMQLLGPCLLDLFMDCGRCFSLKTVFLIAEQMITAMENMHNKGYLHRDIKPDNMCVGIGENADTLFLIDFGLSKEYIVNGKHISCQKNIPFQGNFYWASSNVLSGLTCSRRDDLESLFYSLYYFLKGDLPWYVTHESRCSPEIVLERRSRISVFEMCLELPPVLANAINYVRSLAFAATPRYDYLRKTFRDAAAKLGIVYDNVFDWEFVRREESIDCCLDDLNIVKSRNGSVRSQDGSQICEKKRRGSGTSKGSRRHSTLKSRRSSKQEVNKQTLPKMLAALSVAEWHSPGSLMKKCNSQASSPPEPSSTEELMERPTGAHSTNEIYDMSKLTKLHKAAFQLNLQLVPGELEEDDSDLEAATPKTANPLSLSHFRERYESYKSHLAK